MSTNSNEKCQEINLISEEKLDRCSPNLWSEVDLEYIKNNKYTNNQFRWMSDLSKEDIDILNELAILTPDQLVDKVKDMMEVAYQLSVEETHQIARGKLLNILDKNDKE